MIRSQSGVTLISLLIGLLISMLCMIGLLSAYRTMAKTGADSRIDATHDTQLQNGLIASQMMIQNAGFRLEAGTNAHLATHTFTSIGTGTGTLTNVSALLWRYKVGSTVACQGLADIADSGKRKLVTLTVSSGCDDTAALSTFTWATDKTLARLTDFGVSNAQQVTYAVTTGTDCRPFGSVAAASGKHPQVTLSAKTSSQQHNSALSTIQVPICILNITS